MWFTHIDVYSVLQEGHLGLLLFQIELMNLSNALNFLCNIVLHLNARCM